MACFSGNCIITLCKNIEESVGGWRLIEINLYLNVDDQSSNIFWATNGGGGISGLGGGLCYNEI